MFRIRRGTDGVCGGYEKARRKKSDNDFLELNEERKNVFAKESDDQDDYGLIVGSNVIGEGRGRIAKECGWMGLDLKGKDTHNNKFGFLKRESKGELFSRCGRIDIEIG